MIGYFIQRAEKTIACITFHLLPGLPSMHYEKLFMFCLNCIRRHLLTGTIHSVTDRQTDNMMMPVANHTVRLARNRPVTDLSSVKSHALGVRLTHLRSYLTLSHLQVKSHAFASTAVI